ncbi:enoyl-CoA hydratase family protein [Oceanicola sp. S124]|uniref:enoyl-CoA hydratase family protein n=1 Tax=Oceanicola sp. S124 TaxID=1042378 RepID=UPI0002557917|nr:enoyl-CoA hydratase family protein [Oceanicola sp. S124]
MAEPIRLTIDKHIAEIVIDNPPVNALDSAGWFLLARTIDRAHADPETRVIVIRAEGRGFCAGVDIKELQAEPGKIIDVNKGNWDTFRAVHKGRAPVIAAAHGYVLGGGIGICGSADIILLADNATLGVPEVDRGALGAGAHLQRMLPLQLVRQMYYTGEPITAAEAARHGAIAEVVAPEALRDRAMAMAEKIAAKSPTMIALAKESLNGVEPTDLERDYRWEQGFTAQAYLTAESQATRDAFVDGGKTADFSKKDKT